MGLHLENEVTVVKTPTIISNNPVYKKKYVEKEITCQYHEVTFSVRIVNAIYRPTSVHQAGMEQSV